MHNASRLQRTIAADTEVQGVGFFHGSDVTLRFRPAGADTGVVFVRTDLPGRPSVRAHVDNVVPTPRRTTVRRGAASVEMIEHVMAALAGLRIDNCTVEIDAPEAPGLDGSSRAYVEAFEAVGTVELDRPRAALVIETPVTVREGQAALTAHPGDGSGLVLSYHLDYGRHTPIGTQSLFLEVTPERFADELAASRTFLLQAEAKILQTAGIGTRATEADLLIFGPDGVVGNSLRYPDECVRHKILDMVGDFALLGQDIQGHVVAYRSGHSLNAALVRALVASTGGGVDDDDEPGPADTVPLHAPVDALNPPDIEGLVRSLPHRYPFPMVDRVLTLAPGRRLTALKNVGMNEPFFAGPFSSIEPVMPGVLVLEALAQAAAILISDHAQGAAQLPLMSAIDEVRIRTPVRPGDQLRLDVRRLGQSATGVTVRGLATVGDLVAAEARFTFVMVDADRSAA
jgi:UDP-3-O-[3-hydroxymyristoyl] N-acetylglucosamine deacetylase / 3-hydroxyacyl-[acyl-carrier-protein] dehydratase